MADSSDHQRTNFLCVDDAPERTGSAVKEGGAPLYFAEISPSLATSTGYTAGSEVTCAHCTVSATTSGSVYMVMGASVCPASDELLYTSMTAGEGTSDTGESFLKVLWFEFEPRMTPFDLSQNSNDDQSGQNIILWVNGQPRLTTSLD